MGIKVLVVDDTAPDAYVARDKMLLNKPDVICLDVEMPRMDGITFLKRIMKFMPTPVIMVSSLTTKGAKTTLDALASGAVDFVAKPHTNIYDSTNEMKEELLEKVKMAATANVAVQKTTITPTKLLYESSPLLTTQKIIAIGSSTGGTEALKDILVKLPANSPSIIIVQHMPASFTKAFADRLNELCDLEVKEAASGDYLGVGQAFIAPGDNHMVLRRSGAKYFLQVGSGQKISGHRPSVDVLFNSVAKVAGENAMGVILTGMGSDGAKGLLNMKKAGSKTLGQNKESCVVYGMPKVAKEIGAVDKEVHIDEMAKEILTTLKSLHT